MVSLLSSSLLAESGDSSSTIGSATSSGQKRKLVSVRRENSLSGYSADREESSVSSPFSIDLSVGLNSKSVRELNTCPKRQKRNERQFAAESVKADMARGGLEFSLINPEIKTTTTLGSVSINLQNVKLVYSKVFDKESTPGPSRAIGTLYDYQSLALSCWESYPRQSIPSTTILTDQDDSESTSSVSESDSESVTSKTNPEPAICIPPLLKEDIVKRNACSIPLEMESCRVVSSTRRTMTMSDSLVLTKTPRLVALACHPFTIVHANAAFLRLSGLPYERIVGSGFSSIVDGSNIDQECIKPILLPDCLESSCSGDHRKLQLVREDEAKQQVERWAKVLAIVEKRPIHFSEVAHVTHFAIDLVDESGLGNDVIDNFSNIKGSPDHADDVAVEVMG